MDHPGNTSTIKQADAAQPAIALAFANRRQALARQPWVSYALVLINVAVWLLTLVSGAALMQAPADKMLVWGGNAASEVQRGEWWRLLTAVFLHNGLMHVAMNMAALLCTGPTVERVYGSRRFILLYLGAGLAGSALSLHFSAQHSTAVGASGAVFGVAGALLVAALRHRRFLPTMLSFYTLGGIGLLLLDAMVRGFGSERVDNAAHVGGLLVGALLALILPERISGRHDARQARWRTAAAGAAALAITAAVALAAPPAKVDVRSAFEAGATMERALREFDMVMGRLALEEKAANAGRMSQPMRADRQRQVHGPAFRKIGADLAAVRLPPADPRAAVLRDLQRMAALMEELAAMPAAFSKGNERVEPADPARHAAILIEVRQLRMRILNWQRAHAPARP
ncbi:rhomboid family intramembrane serine protease [Noviherbaspirillum suwonense]|uniref:Membrane associated serine protease, rhomboid family n=1 Tax=Noviherbaspirillum suwonense TaxID=1224511 RepID=A0ABY1QIT2_9BURK|nr:rhomboid family intramembrane serine protease [Noviherbaspirillum suwonense]SMP72080.1 Membrane associated serine protease, rhomboid family [Noviherbaspirillum suwonense]